MKINKKAFMLILSSALILTSCKSTYGDEEEKISIGTPIIEEERDTCIMSEDNTVSEEISEEEIVEETDVLEEETVKERSIEDAIFTDYLLTVKPTNFRDAASSNSNIIDTIQNNTKITSYSKYDDDYYEVIYNDVVGYVHKSCVREDYTITFPYEYKEIIYLTEDTPLFVKTDEIITLPKYECLEVYEDFDDGCLLVASNEYVGYITRTNTQSLTGTFVVVDLSDQELKLYEDGKVILTSPLVTGKPSTPTDEGIFAIYDITRSRYLVGEGYKSYVDVMMKYNGGEGLHDAEYHTCDGFSHGWRDRSEFGGETYLTNGSHGCDNMPHEEAMEVYNHVEIGTPVLVKK